MIDLNVIPASNRNKASIALHVEIYNRTMDTVRVHNPTDKDFMVYNDRRFSNEQYQVPNKNRNIGFGPGMNDVPRFIALRFVDKLGMEMISEIIKDDWDKKKGKFRLEEQGQMEERLALRSSDPKIWEDITKQLWIGVVKRYQGEVYEEPEAREPRKEYGSTAEETIARLEMNDTEIDARPQGEVPEVEDAKDSFARSIT